MAPRPPAGYQRLLRQRVGENSLEIRFDTARARKSGREAWKVVYREAGRETYVCGWPHNLDGNLNALVAQVRKFDLRNVRYKDYVRGLEEREDAEKRRQAAARQDDFEQRAGYVRKAAAGVFEGKADNRFAWQVPADLGR